MGPPVEHAIATNLSIPFLGIFTCFTCKGFSFSTFFVSSFSGSFVTFVSIFFLGSVHLSFVATSRQSRSFLENASLLSSSTSSGFVIKSKAPSSKASIVSFASSVVMALTTITVVFIFCFLISAKNSRPFILGILMSNRTASILSQLACNIFSPSRPFIAEPITWNLLSPSIISEITLLMSAESSIIKIFFAILYAFLNLYSYLFNNDYFLSFFLSFRSCSNIYFIKSSLSLSLMLLNSALCS